MFEDRFKEAIEDADRKWALKDVAMATTKDKGKVAEDAKKRAREAKKARALAKHNLVKTGEKLGDMELKLAEIESLSLV